VARKRPHGSIERVAQRSADLERTASDLYRTCEPPGVQRVATRTNRSPTSSTHRGTSLPAPTFILTNARIWTGQASDPEAEAIAARGGRIVAVGSRREIERTADSRTEILDAAGRRVIPGLIDAHVHLIWAYELGHWIDLSDRPSLLEIQRRVREYAHAHPEEEIILGHGFDYAELTDAGLPTAQDLDTTVYDRPVLLTAWDGHTGWGNTRFVERAQAVLAKLRRDVGGMERDPKTRKPTGIFTEAFDITAWLPECARRKSIEGLERILTAASGYGITTGFDVQVPLDTLEGYEQLRNRNGLPLRIRAAIYHPRGTLKARYPEFMNAVAKAHDDWFGVGAVKLYIDGVQETGTAAMLEPYSNDVASRGKTVYPVGEYQAIVADLDRRGFQILTHACGDRGVRLALDAYEKASETNRMIGRRHRIEHCENLAPEDVPRFAQLGVIPCMMPRHTAPELTRRWREAVGPARARRAFPWKALLRAGAGLAFASDWPVADLNPWVGIQAAVHRIDASGDLSEQHLTLEQALVAYTRSAAFASHCETTRGSLEVGKYPDMVVLAPDPFETPPEKLEQVRTVATVVDGKTVFADPENGPGPD
jgi:predicted amidohydrolase YtcJ